MARSKKPVPEVPPAAVPSRFSGLAYVLVALVLGGAAFGVWKFTSGSRSQTASAAAPASTAQAASPAKPGSSGDFQPTVENKQPAPGTAPANMTWIPGGEFSMGALQDGSMNQVGMQATVDSRADPSRVRRWLLDGQDRRHQRGIRKFVKATGYVTVAERKPRRRRFPGAPPENLVAGAVIFSPPDHPVPLERSLSVVVLRARRELAPSRRTEIVFDGPRQVSRR